MILKTSSTSWKRELRETYLWSLKRNRGMMALFAALLFLAFPVLLLFGLANANIRMDPMTLEVYGVSAQYASVFGDMTGSAMTLSVPTLCALFTLLFAVQLFRYMHMKRSVDLFHSLPVRRSAMLLGRILAGLTALYIPLALNVGIASLIALCFNIENKGGQIGDLFVQMLGLMLVLAAAFLFCVLMAVCTGTTLDMVLSVIGVNIAYPILVYSSVYLVSCLLPGFNMTVNLDNTLLVALAPFVGIFLHASDAPTFFVWWAILAVFLLLSSVYLYRRRKSESAENTFAFQIPKGLIRFLITAVGGFGLGFILFWYNSSTANFLIGLLLGSLAAHVVVEAIYSRGFSRMKRSFAGYAVFLGAFIVFYGVVATGAFGYVDRIPAIEDIESVSFEDNTYYQEFGSDHFDIQGEQYENLASVKPEICQVENVEKVLEFHRSVVEFQKQAGFPFRMSQGGGIQYQIVYHLKDGSTFQREYQWSPFNTPNAEENSQRLQQLSSDIVNSEEYKTSGNLLFYLEPGDISQIEIENYDEQSDMAAKTYRLNDAQKQALLEALRQDTLDLDITNREDFSGRVACLYLRCGDENGLFQPAEGSKLKNLVGDYTGKIQVSISPYTLTENQKDLAVVQLLEEQGWTAEES